MEETEETIKRYCVETKNGDYIVMSYQLRKKVSKEIIEEFKNLSMEFVQYIITLDSAQVKEFRDLIMFNLTKISILEAVKPMLESIKNKFNDASPSDIRIESSMLSFIVREYLICGLEKEARAISDAQAIICLPSDSIDPVSNTLSYVKIEDSRSIILNKP